MSESKEVLLVRVFGHDRPGVTAQLAELLSQTGATVLDIGQAVIHDSLSLGLLVDLCSSQHKALTQKIDALMQETGLQVRFSYITERSYQDWVGGQGKPRYILTLLSNRISAEAVASVTAIIAGNLLNIDHISRLSGRPSLSVVAEEHQTACVEFSLRGEPTNLDSMRADLMEVANIQEVDIAFQRDSAYRRNRRLVVFDMDSTLIDCEVIDQLAIAAGVGNQVAAITERAMAGELDFDASFRERLSLLAGLDESALSQIARELPLMCGAEKLINTLKVLGYKTAILSGGFQYFGDYLQQRLGIDYVYANTLELIDGKVSGKVSGEIVNGEKKAELLCKIAEQEGIALEQVIAVGDGANDLPMLSKAGLGIAFHAKPMVKQTARHAISQLGLDGILYLIGVRDREQSELLG